MIVHNHGPAEDRGLDCPERLVDGRLRGACLRTSALDPSTCRETLADLAVLYGTFMIGRWAEVMASDDEPADDWQEQAAREAVDLFAPAAGDFLAQIVAEAKAAALREAADEVERVERVGLTPSNEVPANEREWFDKHRLRNVDGYQRHRPVVADWLRDRAARACESSTDPTAEEAK